jgi:SNF2 family DNA or RNA helicase
MTRLPHVWILSYSKIAGWADFLAGQMKTVIFDEMQELRHTGTDKYAAGARLANDTRYRVGLTATPIYNYAGEIHSVVSILDPDALGSPDEFAREWASGGYDGRRGCRVTDPAALGTYLRDQGLLLRRTRAEVGRELPPVVTVEQNVDCDHAVLDRLAGDAAKMAQLVLDKAANQTERWRAAGELDLRMRHATGVAKARFVAEFVRLLLESEERVVVWAWHRDVYTLLMERLAEFNPVMYTGSETTAEKEANAEAFKTGGARVLLMSLRSGAGLDGLQGVCKVGVFAELDWSPAVHHQAGGRLARDGQPDSVVLYYMISDSGSDPPIAEVLDIKRQQAEPVMNPEQGLFTTTEASLDRSQLLAREVLRRRGGAPS